MVSVTQSDRSCALHDFAKRGNVDEIDRLLSADGYGIGQEAAPIIDSMDKLGYTALHWAVEKGHEDCINSLIARGANVNALASNKRTPLHEAAEFGHASIAKKLMRAGADLAAKTTGFSAHGPVTPLDMAKICQANKNCVIHLQNGSVSSIQKQGLMDVDYTETIRELEDTANMSDAIQVQKAILECAVARLVSHSRPRPAPELMELLRKVQLEQEEDTLAAAEQWCKA
mmetsp:Transcript_48957/g.117943  ORF Transcript_48957/g.117943 Transcript_48957/m.117943 type:complete len:229 (+) Transcript_48957:22-708(+)